MNDALGVPLTHEAFSIYFVALAGLWETWRSRANETIRSFTIVTTMPNELCANLHNRMPVILPPNTWPIWLGEEPAEPAELKSVLVPYTGASLENHGF